MCWKMNCKTTSDDELRRHKSIDCAERLNESLIASSCNRELLKSNGGGMAGNIGRGRLLLMRR